MKDYIICKPIMLPTTDISAPIHMEKYESWLFPNKGNLSGTHHLYLVSEQKIKEGNYGFGEHHGYNGTRMEVYQQRAVGGGMSFGKQMKVIATTDKSLSLPLIPSSFIERWVNEQGKIDKVRVRTNINGAGKQVIDTGIIHHYNGNATSMSEIIILPIEDKTYNKEDMFKAWIAGATCYTYHPTNFQYNVGFDEWFDKNY